MSSSPVVNPTPASHHAPTTGTTALPLAEVNSLTDLTVGYMAAPWQGGRMTEHQQYCVVRNARGQQMLDLLGNKLELGEAADVLETAGRFGSVDDRGVVLMLDDGYSDD